MSFSDAEGDIAVVEFTILDAHDAAMALSLVRAALALTKHASAVVGVVAVRRPSRCHRKQCPKIPSRNVRQHELKRDP